MPKCCLSSNIEYPWYRSSILPDPTPLNYGYVFFAPYLHNNLPRVSTTFSFPFALSSRIRVVLAGCHRCCLLALHIHTNRKVNCVQLKQRWWDHAWEKGFLAKQIQRMFALSCSDAASLSCGLFVWLVVGGWCWFVLREKYCWLVGGGWFVLRE
jgi:hypothetical protein